MNKFEDKKEAARWVFAVLISFVVCVGLAYIISYLYEQTSNLAFYLLDVWYNDSLTVVIFFLLTVVLGSYVFEKKEKRRNLKLTLRFFFIFALVYIFFVNIFGVSKKYEDVLISGKSPSKFVYKYNIFMDVIGGKTELIEIPVENISTDISSYVIRSRTSTSSRITYYVILNIDNKKYSSAETRGLYVCINSLIKNKDKILIEYYPHTGIIKSVDGIDKNDIHELVSHAGKVENEAIKEQQRIEQESIKKEEEEREKSAIEYTVLSSSIGKNFAEIEAMLSEKKIPPTYEIVYISSKMYETNTIAFYDDDIVYVVKDNLSEDLIPIPRIVEGMTKEQIINILTEAGFSYECDEFECDSHGRNRLHTKGHANGEYVPRQHKVWFSVDK